MNLANDMPEAGYSTEQSKQIKEEVDYYTKVSAAIKIASRDYPDLKQYEPAMRRLLDDYVRADDSQKLSAFDDISLVELIVKRGEEGLNDLPEEIKSSQGAMNTRAKRALYTNLGNDEERALALDAIIRQKKKDGWNGGNIFKEREVLYAVRDELQDDDLAKQIFEIVKKQDEYNK